MGFKDSQIYCEQMTKKRHTLWRAVPTSVNAHTSRAQQLVNLTIYTRVNVYKLVTLSIENSSDNKW
jgi:hypothetical protein